MRHKSLAFKVLLVTLIVFSEWSNTVFADKAGHILIIANSVSEPYQQAIKGFKDDLSGQQGKRFIRFTDLYLNQIDNGSLVIDRIIRENQPDLIYSLGEQSTELAMKSTLKIPILATLVANSQIFQRTKNITGVSMAYPLATQIEWLKKFFPGDAKVAILFNPQENAERVKKFGEIARHAGLNLIPIPVDAPKQLPYALEQLEKDIDLLLAIPDEIAMSPITAQEILLASFRNRVPLIGLSDNWVKSGALYALSWDYQDLGRQCAVQSVKLLKGIPIEKVYPEFPRKIVYSINAKIARHMNVEISETLLKNAKIIFN
ncbi:MAG: ABC transporter substrate-binding protein [Methylococcaceae bacterium]